MHLKVSFGKWWPFCVGLNVIKAGWCHMVSKNFINIGSGISLAPAGQEDKTWTSVDLSSIRSSDICLRTIPWEMPKIPISEMCLKNTYSKLWGHINTYSKLWGRCEVGDRGVWWRQICLYFWLITPVLHTYRFSWWCHQMEILSTSLALCEGNPPVTGGFPSQRPVMCSFDVFFDLHLNKHLSKQSRCQWFVMPSHSL